MSKDEITKLAGELKSYISAFDAEEFASFHNHNANNTPTDTPIETASCKTQAGLPDGMSALATEVNNCKKCPLGEARIKPVFGVGNTKARIMFVGEGPGYEEDRQGEPFVGRAGKLLDKMLAAMGLDRTEVYIANIVKCHPMVDPQNPDKRGNDRPPTPEEAQVCIEYLHSQIKLIDPEFIVALGAVAGKYLLDTKDSLSRLRGQFFNYKNGRAKIICTFHPAALLRNPNWKKDAWQDMLALLKAAGLKPRSAS